MTRNDIKTAEELWEAACRHFPVVSHEEQRAGMVLLRELTRGEPVAIDAMCKPADCDASWLKVLKNDKRFIFSAAAHSQRAGDFLHDLQPAVEAEHRAP